MTALLCCHEGKDFNTQAKVYECATHEWRGKLPCPWPICTNQRQYQSVVVDVTTTAASNELALLERTVHVRKRARIGHDDSGYASVYFWELKAPLALRSADGSQWQSTELTREQLADFVDAAEKEPSDR